MQTLLDFFGRRGVLPRTIVRWMGWVRGRPYPMPRGSVYFGDLRRLSPIGRNFGYERGTPVDRFYIEDFLARNADDIRGHVLEAGSNHYTLRFGGTRVQRSAVLTIETNSRATLVGYIPQPR